MSRACKIGLCAPCIACKIGLCAPCIIACPPPPPDGCSVCSEQRAANGTGAQYRLLNRRRRFRPRCPSPLSYINVFREAAFQRTHSTFCRPGRLASDPFSTISDQTSPSTPMSLFYRFTKKQPCCTEQEHSVFRNDNFRCCGTSRNMVSSMPHPWLYTCTTFHGTGHFSRVRTGRGASTQLVKFDHLLTLPVSHPTAEVQLNFLISHEELHISPEA